MSKPSGKSPDLSRHLVRLSTAIRLRMGEGLIARGHGLRPSTAQVIPILPSEGLRMSALAERLRLTLQRTGHLVNQLEEVGYLTRVLRTGGRNV
jgi:DNA-binding MarR family transcriptional regulator